MPIFESLPENSLSNLADKLTEIKYKPNEYIIRQGAIGQNFYIIADGQVKVTVKPILENSEIDQNQEEQFVRKMTKGEWFGEKALKG